MTKIQLRELVAGEWEKVRDQLSVTGGLLDYRVSEANHRLNVTIDVDLREPSTREIVRGLTYISLADLLKGY